MVAAAKARLDADVLNAVKRLVVELIRIVRSHSLCEVLLQAFPKVSENPFTSHRKMMSTLHRVRHASLRTVCAR